MRGQRPEQVAHPPDAFRVQPVGRLVENQHLRVPEQRRRQAETLPHAQRVCPECPAAGHREPDKLQDLIRPRQGDARGLADDAQMITSGTPLVGRAGLQDGADPADRLIQAGVAGAADGGCPRRRLDQVQEHAQCRRLPGAVGTEETGDPARFHHERHVVHGLDAAVLPCQPGNDDPPVGELACRDRLSPEGPLRQPGRGAINPGGCRCAAIARYQPGQAAEHKGAEQDDHLTSPATAGLEASRRPAAVRERGRGSQAPGDVADRYTPR